MTLKRREFIKNSCALCAGVLGISAILPALEGCAPLNYLDVPVVNGSIKVAKSAFNQTTNLVILKNEQFDYTIAVVKKENIRAFELKCTHQPNPLIATNTGFYCNLHGSSFNLDGKVTNPPASANLNEFKILEEEDQYIVLLK